MRWQNVVIEYRFANGEMERLSALATDLVRLDVDIIIASGSIRPRMQPEGDHDRPDRHVNQCRSGRRWDCRTVLRDPAAILPGSPAIRAARFRPSDLSCLGEMLPNLSHRFPKHGSCESPSGKQSGRRRRPWA